MPELQISFIAKDLENQAGMFGTSDPLAVVTIVEGDEDQEVLGQTEVVKNTLNPKWMKTFVIDYDPDVPTAIKVEIYDKEVDDDNKMGGTFFDIENIIETGHKNEESGDFEGVKGKKMRNGGVLYCRLMETWEAGNLNLMIRGKDLKNVEGFFATSDPFYELCRKEGDKWVSVHRSEFIKNELSPIWDEEKFDLSTLCDGDFQMPILLAVWDHEGSGDHKLIGEVETTVSEILSAKSFGGGGDNSDDDANNLIIWDKDGNDAGCISIINATITGVPDEEYDFSGDEEED